MFGMHFRHADDEILFGRLKAQLIQSLQGAPSHMITNVLRVLGRIESVAFYEGVRQGAVARAIEDALRFREDDLDVRPIAQHARVYGGGFTPLTNVEAAYAKRLAKGDTPVPIDPGLEAEPLEMPPMTLEEAIASPARAFGISNEAPPPRSARRDGFDPGTLDDALAQMEAESAMQVSTIVATDGSDGAERPSFIETCRDALQGRMLSGWTPGDWSELVFAVRDELKVDPYSVDLSLSTDVGKSMLRSIGLFDIADSALGVSEINAILQGQA